MYEHFEHTADLGLRVKARNLNELFAEAARGLFAMVVEDIDSVQPVHEMAFEVDGGDRTYLLFDWLNELLFLFDTERIVLSQFEVRTGPSGLTATGRGEHLDAGRHRISHEVK